MGANDPKDDAWALVPVNYKLPRWLVDALKRLAKKNSRKITAEVELAIRKHLKQEKAMPEEPPQPSQ